MNTMHPVELSHGTDILWQWNPTDSSQMWQFSQDLGNLASQWRGYLNHLSLCAFQLWIEEQQPSEPVSPVGLDSQAYPDWILGTRINLENYSVVVLPSDSLDSEELRVSQEWIDIPEWVADYYIAAQVNPEDGFVRMWGYASHRQLKQAGHFCERDRAYVLASDALNVEMASLRVSQQYFSAEQTRAAIADLPALSATQAEALLAQWGRPNARFARLMVPFETWGAFLAHHRWRQLMLERITPKMPGTPSRFIQLQDWLQHQFTDDWVSLESLLAVRSVSPIRQDAHRLARAKVIDLGLWIQRQPIALIVWIQPTLEDYEIRLEVRPTGTLSTLPPHLKLTILNDQQETLTELYSREQDNWIELSFTVDPGTQFSVQLDLRDASHLESFII